MSRLRAPVCLAWLLSATAAAAQGALPVLVAPSTVAPVVAVAMPSPYATGAALPANTEIWLSPNAEVNSKHIKSGGRFEMSVSRDVMLGNYVVIPRGTRGYGQIGFRTGKGAFGKSAKMEFDVVDVEMNGRTIPTTGHYRIEGQGNTGATVGAIVAVGVFSAFVTGHSAIIAQGNEYKAFTTNALPVVLAPATAAVVAIAPPTLPVAAIPTVVPARPAPAAVTPVSARAKPS